MENIKKYNKLKLCSYYEKGKCHKSKENCNYAHGKDDLREFKKKCINGLDCFKENCHFSHPKGWNYKNNINICEYYKKGFCRNEDYCNFKHINKENDKIIDNEINNDIELHENKECQENYKTNIYDYIKEIINNHLHEDIVYNIIENNNNDIDNNLSLNFTITVDGIEYRDSDNIFNNNNKINKIESTNINSDNKDIDHVLDDTIGLINGLQNEIDKYIKNIKKEIDQTFINDKKKYGINMKLELNQIISLMNLFKDNYKDIIKIN
jgi:hypothetical protein